MSRPILKLKYPPQQWEVEMSFRVEVPTVFKVKNIEELRSRVQAIANRPSRVPFGPIEFIGDDRIIHCYFTDKLGDRRRFMRLRRI